MRKTLEKYVLKPVVAGAFAASLFLTPVSINNPYTVLAQYSQEKKSKIDKKLEELLSREKKIESRDELRNYLEYGNELYEQKRWDDCIQLYKHALGLCKNLEEQWLWYAYHNLGGAYFNKGDYNEALIWMDKALNAALQGGSGGVIAFVNYGKALIHYKLKDYETALHSIDISLKLYSQLDIPSPEGWYAKALILKDFAQTIEDSKEKQEMLNSALDAVKQAILGYKFGVPHGNEEELKEGLEASEQLKKVIERILKNQDVNVVYQTDILSIKPILDY